MRNTVMALSALHDILRGYEPLRCDAIGSLDSPAFRLYFALSGSEMANIIVEAFRLEPVPTPNRWGQYESYKGHWTLRIHGAEVTIWDFVECEEAKLAHDPSAAKCVLVTRYLTSTDT
jgi:hypothetical protein